MSFEYERPADRPEAARFLAEPGAVAKMGGCDVLMRFPQRPPAGAGCWSD